MFEELWGLRAKVRSERGVKYALTLSISGKRFQHDNVILLAVKSCVKQEEIHIHATSLET